MKFPSLFDHKAKDSISSLGCDHEEVSDAAE